MSQSDEFEFWMGEYLLNPSSSECETERLLASLCAQGNWFALEYVRREELRKTLQSNTDSPLNTFGNDDAEDAQPSIRSSAEIDYSDDWENIAKGLKNERGWKCEICGYKNLFSSLIQVHHIDGDKSDNSRANLQILCAVCHGLKHGHGPIWPQGVQEAEENALRLHHWRLKLKAQ